MSRRRTRNPAQDENLDEAAEARRKREEFLREQAERDRALEQSRRSLFTAFKMWTVCPDSRCRRHQACRGDVEECLHERWRPIAPPELKSLLGKISDNVRDGLTLEEAINAAYDDMERHRAAQERLAAQLAEPQPRMQREPAAPPPAQRATRQRRASR